MQETLAVKDMKHRLRMLGYQGLDILTEGELRRLYYEEILLVPKKNQEIKCSKVTVIKNRNGRATNSMGDAV